MQVSKFILLVISEISVLLIIILAVIIFKNRSLQRLVNRLQERMEQLLQQIKSQKTLPETTVEVPPPPEQPTLSYLDHISSQLGITKSHHKALGSDQDIVLDIEPDTPLPRRAAALRYAILLAEKEALASANDDMPNWNALNLKYEQIFCFYEDFVATEPAGNDNSEVDALNEELTTAKKRINNLEKFKALYFDLEEKWQGCQDKAKTNYENLSAMASQVENPESFERALTGYHEAYSEVTTLIEGGVEGTTIATSNENLEDAAGEIRHLKNVATDQHKIINELQKKLERAISDEEKGQIVEDLQNQLQKHKRFVSESETCIQLLEDELMNSNKEIDQLRARVNQIGNLKSEIKDIRDERDKHEMNIHTLKTANMKLIKSLKAEKNKPQATSNTDSTALKQELSELQKQYTELEEKYLSLKLMQ